MNTWHKIQQLLKQNQTLYLLTVVESIGSAPGRCKFKMIVANNGELYGSIGGGIMEFNMVEKARKLLSQNRVEQHIVKQIHKGDASASSGMICSGSQRIAFNYLAPKDLSVVDTIINAHQSVEYSNNGIVCSHSFAEYGFQRKSDKDWVFRELINQKPCVHIFGAGHVSVPTSRLLMELGFQVNVYDNRTDLNTFDENKMVTNKQRIDYNNVFEFVSIRSEDYVVLMTHKFTEDKAILAQLLRFDYKYLGVLGSKNKINVMFEALLKENIPQQQLNKVHAPIGIEVNSQTPMEIGISIVAEIIAIKNLAATQGNR